jgi:hypothetical protein
MRCGLRAGWRDRPERLCQETDESSTHYNKRHTSSGSGVSALRPRRQYGRHTRVGSILSAFRHRGLIAHSLFPWRASQPSFTQSLNNIAPRGTAVAVVLARLSPVRRDCGSGLIPVWNQPHLRSRGPAIAPGYRRPGRKVLALVEAPDCELSGP